MRIRDWSSYVCSSDLADAIRVALCYDHSVVRSGLRHILYGEAYIVVVGEAANAKDAVAIARSEHPDVFVMDLGLPGTGGITATRQVREASPSTAVLILTVHDDVGYLRKAFDAGASGYLVKERSEEHTSELQSLMRNSYAVFCLKQTHPPTQTLST